MPFTEQQWLDILKENEGEDMPGWVFVINVDDLTTFVSVRATRLDGSERLFKEASEIALEKARRSYEDTFKREAPSLLNFSIEAVESDDEEEEETDE